MRALASLFLCAFISPALADPDYATPIEVTATPVQLEPRNEDASHVGRLRYLGGLVLRSSEGRFSGLSGMRFRGNELLLITDRGHFVQLAPVMTGGRLTSVADVRWWNMLSPNGAPVREHGADAESLELVGQRAFVGFERFHRIWSYDLSGEDNPPAEEFRNGTTFGDLTFNSSLEGMTQLASGAFLAIEEEPSDGYMDGWILGATDDEEDAPLFLEAVPPFKLTDLATLPNGDVLTLERRFSPIGGVGARLRLIAADTIEPRTVLGGEEIAELGASHTVDNMEGLAVREVDGRLQIFIVSDNNQNAFQRTILMAFELVE